MFITISKRNCLLTKTSAMKYKILIFQKGTFLGFFKQIILFFLFHISVPTYVSNYLNKLKFNFNNCNCVKSLKLTQIYRVYHKDQFWDRNLMPTSVIFVTILDLIIFNIRMFSVIKAPLKSFSNYGMHSTDSYLPLKGAKLNICFDLSLFLIL